MTNNNYQSNAPCPFGETLVAVLYDEASQTESSDFFVHLDDCAMCREEFAAFGGVKNSVACWREIEFSALQTPVITLPEQRSTVSPATIAMSRRERWREFFAPRVFGWQTAAAFSLLAVFAAFVFVFVETNKELPENTAAFDSAPQTQTVAKDNNPGASQNEQELRVEAELISNQEQKQRAASTKNDKPAIKAAAKITATAKPRQKTNARRGVLSQTQTAKDLEVLPDEFEDNSLRLVELLEEVEPSE